ncbi:MAG TPA: serine hydrolase [Steroidobacteraceae bacterium]
MSAALSATNARIAQAPGAARAPLPNSAFHPGPDARPAPAFAGVLHCSPTRLVMQPPLEEPLIEGRDASIFPGIALELFTLEGLLVPVQRGEMVRESVAGAAPSYWRMITQPGRIWRESDDAAWSWAAFPLTLVNDTENHAHQGLARFCYRDGQISPLTVQFVQQSAPYRLRQHFIAWGEVAVRLAPADRAALEEHRARALDELASRLPAKPWSALPASTSLALEGFGGPVLPRWRVATALFRDGTLYVQDSQTPFGAYPYPLEMRFGVRSVMKSIGAPLALLHLAQQYGPWVLSLNIGDYVSGLHPKWRRIRFLDAANMTSGFGGTGSVHSNPNDVLDGYLEADYDGWYTAPSHDAKLARINASLRPYPWEPGTVMRYRDQDFYLLGAALDGFLKSQRAGSADLWEMLSSEVFGPIGIQHAPAVRTREAGGRDGLIWLSAGYYPTLDELAKIARLYLNRGEHAGRQILHRQLTQELLAARDAIRKDADRSLAREGVDAARSPAEYYKMGFHFRPYHAPASGHLHHLPMMSGAGGSEVILYPDRSASIVIAKALHVPDGEPWQSDDPLQTIRAMNRLAPF